MSVIISKDEQRTIIATMDEKYVINQVPDKGIELSIGSMGPAERFSYRPEIRLSIPIGTKTLEKDTTIGNIPEITIWPIPLNVLTDIQERTNGDIKVEDISDYVKETEPGKEFFIRIKGYILIAGI